MTLSINLKKNTKSLSKRFSRRLAQSPPTTSTWWSTLALRWESFNTCSLRTTRLYQNSMIENPNFSMTETKYFQAVPILLIGNTAPHDVLVKRKPTRNVFKNLCDYRLCSALFCEEQLREITTLKKHLLYQIWSFTSCLSESKLEVWLPSIFLCTETVFWNFDTGHYLSGK